VTTSSTSTTWLAKNVPEARKSGRETDPVVSESWDAKPPRRRAFQKRTRPTNRYGLLAALAHPIVPGYPPSFRK